MANALDIGAGITQGMERGLRLGLAYQYQERLQKTQKLQEKKHALQVGKAFADIFKPGQSAAVTELKSNLFAQLMGVDTKSEGFKTIQKFATKVSSQEQKEIYDSILALVPQAKPAQIMAISKKFATDPSVAFTLMEQIEGQAQKKRFSEAGQIAAGFGEEGDPDEGADPRRVLADRYFAAARNLKANAQTEEDFKRAEAFEDQANEILQGKTTQVGSDLLDVSDITRPPKRLVTARSKLELLQDRRDRLPEGSKARKEVQSAIDKETKQTITKIEKLFTLRDRTDDPNRKRIIDAAIQKEITTSGVAIEFDEEGRIKSFTTGGAKLPSGNKVADIKAQINSLDQGMDIIKKLSDLYEQDITRFGVLGGFRVKGKELSSVMEDLGLPINTFVDTAIELLGDEGLSEEEKKRLLTDPKLSDVQVLENSLAIILARARQPQDRLLTDVLKGAQKNTKLLSGGGSRAVADRLKSIMEELKSIKAKQVKRLPRNQYNADQVLEVRDGKLVPVQE